MRFLTFFDLLQADKSFELTHELVEIGLFGLFRGRLCGGRGLACGDLRLHVLFLEARFGRRDKIERVERLLGPADAARVADGGELVRTFGYVFGLGQRHVVVDRGEIEQNIREHADEGAGRLRTALCVGLGKVPVEHRRHEHLTVAHGACQSPEHPCGTGLIAGVYLICEIDMLLRYAGAAAPELERAGGHEAVELLCQRVAAEAVKGVCVGGIYLVKILGGTVPCSRHSA